MRRLVIASLALALVAAACSGPGDEEVASVGDAVITVDDVSYLFATDSIPVDSNFRLAAFRLVAREVLEDALADDFGVTVDEAVVEETYQDFAAQVAQSGSNVPEVFNEDRVLRFDAYLTVIRDLVIDQLVLAPEIVADVRERYEANPAAFATVCASHILVNTLEEAETVMGRLDAGEDFAALAGELSTDINTPGGDLGCTTPTTYVTEFADATMEAAIGELYGPVETTFGFHVIVVDDRVAPTIDEVAADPGSYLPSQEVQTLWLEWLDAELASVEITVNPEFGVWNAETQRIDAPPEG